jgi:hypothetical protein
MADSLNQFMINMKPVYKARQKQHENEKSAKAKKNAEKTRKNRRRLFQHLRFGNTEKSNTRGFNFTSPPANLTRENAERIYDLRRSRIGKRFVHEGNTAGRYEFTEVKPAVHPGRFPLNPALAPLFANLHARSDSRNEFKAKLNRRQRSGALRPNEHSTLLRKFNALYPEGITNVHVDENLLEMTGNDILDLTEAEFNRLASKLSKEDLAKVVKKIYEA